MIRLARCLRFVAIGVVLIGQRRPLARRPPLPTRDRPRSARRGTPANLHLRPAEAAKEKNGFIACRKTFTLPNTPRTATLRLDADGRPVVKTDETWKWSAQTRYRPARVNWAHIIDLIDTRVEDGDSTLTDYDDRTWQPAVKISGDSWGPLTARRIPLLRDTPVEPKFTGDTRLPSPSKPAGRSSYPSAVSSRPKPSSPSRPRRARNSPSTTQASNTPPKPAARFTSAATPTPSTAAPSPSNPASPRSSTSSSSNAATPSTASAVSNPTTPSSTASQPTIHTCASVCGFTV